MLVDTHAHLNFSAYEKDLEEVIKRALKAEVKKIICVSSNLKDSLRALEITKKYSGIVFPAVGIHPHCTDPENKDSVSQQLEQLERLIKENKNIVAIGECGLDITEPLPEERKRSMGEQKDIFLGQVGLAIKHDLPILIHCNKAYENLYEILKSKIQNPPASPSEAGRANDKQKSKFQISNYKLRGIFHFYTGGKKRLSRFFEFKNFLFGFAGTTTYEEGIQNVIKEVPLERLVLETDCPFLAPLPYRGKRNEPSYIPLIAEKVAEIKGINVETVGKATTKNAERIFGI